MVKPIGQMVQNDDKLPKTNVGIVLCAANTYTMAKNCKLITKSLSIRTAQIR